MIRSFADGNTEELFVSGRSRRFRAIEKVAKRKLDALHVAKTLDDLRIPPGNRLHSLTGDREGQHAIWVNDQYRVCFAWKQEQPANEELQAEGHAYDVAVTDYH